MEAENKYLSREVNKNSSGNIRTDIKKKFTRRRKGSNSDTKKLIQSQRVVKERKRVGENYKIWCGWSTGHM